MKFIKNLKKQNRLIKKGKIKGYEYCVAHNNIGYRLGYVKISETPLEKIDNLEGSSTLQCHGGITFDVETNSERWIGFDCAHDGDLPDPSLKREENTKIDEFLKLFGGIENSDNETIKDENFVLDEIKSIINQLIELEKTNSNEKNTREKL